MEFTSPDGNQQSHATVKPLKRLLKAVKSMSPTALSASVSDIGSVLSMIDTIAGTTTGKGSRIAIGDDLSAKTRCHLQAWNFSSHYGCAPAKWMKCHMSAMVMDPLSSPDDSFKQPNGQISDPELTATSKIKRRRTELNITLLEEIRDISQRLVETVMDVVSDLNEDEVRIEPGEGTVVRCSYRAVALYGSFKLQCASFQMFPILPLRLFVPKNYPNSSPLVLDRLPVDWSHDSKECEDLWEKAKSRFYISLRNLSQPMSLEEMARTWDVCARAVFSEYTQHIGGECFSSTYGTWKNCVTAS